MLSIQLYIEEGKTLLLGPASRLENEFGKNVL